MRAGLPDTLFRDCFAISANDYAAEELATLRSVVEASGVDLADALFPKLARLSNDD